MSEQDWDELLAERIAIMTFCGELSERQAQQMARKEILEMKSRKAEKHSDS